VFFLLIRKKYLVKRYLQDLLKDDFIFEKKNFSLLNMMREIFFSFLISLRGLTKYQDIYYITKKIFAKHTKNSYISWIHDQDFQLFLLLLLFVDGDKIQIFIIMRFDSIDELKEISKDGIFSDASRTFFIFSHGSFSEDRN